MIRKSPPHIAVGRNMRKAARHGDPTQRIGVLVSMLFQLVEANVPYCALDMEVYYDSSEKRR